MNNNRISLYVSRICFDNINIDLCIKNGSKYLCTPERAFIKYLHGISFKHGWIEDSKDISDEMPISKRELFALIVLAHLKNHSCGESTWMVGYDSNGGEPNDGLITNGIERLNIEHKVIPQMAKGDPLDNILSTYTKNALKGEAYGQNRVLVIHANQESIGLIKISDLRDRIKGDSPFDSVLLMNAVAMRDRSTVVIHVTEHYPNAEKGVFQVNLDLVFGGAKFVHCPSKF